MGSDTESEGSIEGEVTTVKASASDWGKAKHDYYYTDYVDKDYPSKLTAKEERLAAIEQEEALKIQKKLLSTLHNLNLQSVFDLDDNSNQDDQSKKTSQEFDLIDFLEKRNKSIDTEFNSNKNASNKRKRVVFVDEADQDSYKSAEEDYDDDDDSDQDIQDNSVVNDDNNKKANRKQEKQTQDTNDKRRPINMAIKKNRGLTPYKKKEYRNPRVKHKKKYKKAMSKRRRNVREAQIEYHRYSGESNGIKTSTVKSIKLC